MKIAIYSGSIPSTTFIENLIKGIGETRQIFLFGTQDKPVNYSNSNIKVYGHSKSKLLSFTINLWRLLLLTLLYPKRLKILKQEVLKHKGNYAKYNWLTKILPVLLHLPDMFHIQWAKDLESWYFLKEHLNVKLVVSLRGAHINYSPLADVALAKSYRTHFPKVDAFHAVSEAIAKEAQKYNAPKENIKVIHSLVPQTTLEQFSLHKKKGTDVLRLVSVGRFHWKKGYRYALDAVSLLKAKGLNVNYTIVASNAISEDLLFHIHQLGLRDEVTILKGQTQLQLFETMTSYDALVLPSLEEGIANVVLEAMAIGLPVISTDCGGMAEVVVPNETGWLVPVRDVEALVDAIQDLMKTSEKDLQRISIKAHQFVKTHFDAEDSIKQFLELYGSVLDKN